MISPKDRRTILAGLAVLLVGLFFLAPALRVSADLRSQPAFQTTPGYQPPATEPSGGNSYPAPQTPTLAGTAQTPAGSPEVTATLTLTPTQAPNVFKTENSEMNGALATPALTETQSPSLTPYLTPTITQTQTAQPSLAPIQTSGSGFPMDWGMFWIGFALPVLAGSGAVLYLLDHRPDLFRAR